MTLTTDTLHQLLAYAEHGTTTPRLVCRNTYAALLRECLASRAVVEAARTAGRREGLERAAAACEAERVGYLEAGRSPAMLGGALGSAVCRRAIRALLLAPARAADAAAGEASDGR